MKLAGGAEHSVIIRVTADAKEREPETNLASGSAQVLITHGSRLTPRQLSPGVVSLDIRALNQNSLLSAVAIATGRQAPEPADHPQQPAQPISAPSVADAHQRGQLILVAEDDEINRTVISHQLQLLGYAVEIAEDGASALALWQQGRFSLLLTDLHMPVLDGYGLTDAIRQKEEAAGISGTTSRLPIVALTANALHGEEERALEHGMDAYLTKPLKLNALAKILDRWLPRG